MTVPGKLLAALREPKFGQRLLLVVGITAIVDTLLWAFGVFNHGLFDQSIYCFGISLSTFLLIDLGRNLWSTSTGPDNWPRGWRLIVHNVLGVIAGYVIGTSFGNWVTGRPIIETLSGSHLATSLPFSMAMATGFIYFFYQRARFEELRREATEAQLLLLQSQLEPHMLFNTLANLRALITTDPERAVQLLDHLNEFLRATLGASRVGTHAVGRELELLRDYLEIMTVRMGPRLRYRIDVDDGVSGLPVPALLLQPLVENGIRHGLEPKPEGGELCIAALRRGNELVFEVNDTGIGLPSTSASSSGFGLTHVRERLQSRYGTRANFSLLPRDGSGTIARVVLPIIE